MINNDKMREAIIKILNEYTREMEDYDYYRSNLGVSVDDYEDIADKIIAWQAAQSVPDTQIAEKNSAIAELALDVAGTKAQLAEAQEQVLVLREALDMLVATHAERANFHAINNARAALAATKEKK